MVLTKVKILSVCSLMFFSWSQFLVLMYLVTYLGRLCNGLTVLIIGKKADARTKCLSNHVINIGSFSRCDWRVFSPTFLQTASGKSHFLLFFIGFR